MDPVLGGPGQGVRNTIPALEKLGVINEVVSLDEPNAEFLRKDPFVIHALGPFEGPWQYGRKLFPWLIENMPRFDAVIVEGLWLYYGHAARKAIQHLKANRSSAKVPKLFVMPHGMLDPYFQRAPERRLKAIRNWVYWKFVESKLINEADGLLFTCDEELTLARQTFRPYHPHRELNIGFGIQEPPPYESSMYEEFLTACPEVRDQPYILFLSRIHEKKGVDILINGYAKSYKAGHPKLVIAGPGLDTAYGQTVQKLAAQHNLKNEIIFPGMLSGKKKWGAFYNCEAFALVSHQENFGIAVVEALACNKVVLISNQVNIWKEIISVGAGLVSEDTADGARNLLESWINMEKTEKLTMIGKTRAAFETLYAIDPAASRVLLAIEKTLSDGVSRS